MYGTVGWPAQAPFDAIMASAGGPEVPETLKHELARLLAQRKQLLQALSEKDRNEYSSLQRLRKGLAVVGVE